MVGWCWTLGAIMQFDIMDNNRIVEGGGGAWRLARIAIDLADLDECSQLSMPARAKGTPVEQQKQDVL